MKSRTSSFNLTVFRKNLTRFAPAWGLYTICALMGLMMLMMEGGSKWMVSDLLSSLNALGIITPCYALLCAQLLFGDLYNTRMCNALHALPMKRESWFLTNVTSGFVFHLIPTGIMSVSAAVILLLYCPVQEIWAAPIWFAGVNLQFLCFFGIAVFCVFCVGSRLAQAVVYGIVNFGAVIAAWLLDTLYIPQFYGIQLDFTPFFNFCPVSKMVASDFVRGSGMFDENMDGISAIDYRMGDGFAYYFIVAAIGIGLLFLAMRLYRRRDLECAGDFMALKGLEPVFLVVYTLIVGAAFYFFTESIMDMDTVFFLFAGLAVGWFTGKMLLERTTRVFRLRSFLGCGALMVGFGLSLVAASLDVFGIVRWVPGADQVESVGISSGWYSPMNIYDEVSLTDPAEIQKVIDIHQQTVDEYEKYGIANVIIETAATESVYTSVDTERMDFSMYLTINYHMKNGRIVSRYYDIWMGGENGQYLKQLFSSPNTVFGRKFTEAEFLAAYGMILIQDTWEGKETYVVSQEDIRDLYRAIVADCEAGTMAQQWDFHRPDESIFWIYPGGDRNITVFSNAENTLNWLREYGLDVDAILDKYR